MAARPLDVAFKALAHPDRRRLLDLTREETSVGELVNATGLTQPAVSQHLRTLREARLITARSDGTRRLYRVDTELLDEVRRYLDGFWTDRLGRLKAVAETIDDGTTP